MNNLYFLLSGHLGGASKTVNASGQVVAELRYMAFGETWYENGNTPTDLKYTGQREFGGLGLYFYQSRFYDAMAGRFVSADTMVPNPASPLAWDRYSYVQNNPIRYSDPLGHKALDNETGSFDNPVDLLEGETPPVPDSPPDFNNPLPNGNPAPPHIDGLPDDQWEWNDNWPNLGPGYRNKEDPQGIIWRPDDVNAGEMPHWHGRLPGAPDITFPKNYKHGRGKQRSDPGTFNPNTGSYETTIRLPQLPEFNLPRLPSLNPSVILTPIIILLMIPLFVLAL